MNTNRLIAFGGIVVVVIVIILVSVLGHKPTTSYAQSGRIASNIQYPSPTSDSIRYFSGSTFASFNLNQKKSAALTRYFNFPDINSVRWSGTKVVFKASGYSPQDDLYKTLVDKGYDPEESYWWSLDLNTSASPKLIEQFFITDVAINQSTNHYVAAYRCGSDAVQSCLYNEDGSRTTVDQTEISRIYYLDNNTAIVSGKRGDTYNIERVNVQQKSSTVLIGDYQNDVTTDKTGKHIAYVQPKNNKSVGDLGVSFTGKLTILDTDTNKATGIQDNVASDISYQPISDSWIFSSTKKGGANSLYVLDAQHKVYQIEPKSNADNIHPLDVLLYQRDPLIAYVIDSTHDMVKISQTGETVSDVPSMPEALYDSHIDVNFTTSFNSDTHKLEVYITKNPYSTSQQQALQYIQKTGGDPTQIDITWHSYPGVDRSK